MKRLLENSAELEIQDIVVPCVDQSSIQDITARSRFQQQLAEIIPHAEKLGVNLSLETDLGPDDLKDLLMQINQSYRQLRYRKQRKLGIRSRRRTKCLRVKDQ